MPLDNPPDEPEGRFLLPNGLCNSSLIKDLNLLNFGSTSTPSSSTFDIDDISIHSQSTGSTTQPFSLSEYLVPLQTKVWGEDWEVTDDFTAFDTQTFSDNNALPFQLSFDSFIGNSPIWENDVIPADQAYDELVFDLAPSAFDSPTTVNVADLIVGPNSMASSTVVSPSDLAMTNDNTYHDIALASYYGFNASEISNSEDELESDDENDEEEDDEDEQVDDNENRDEDVEVILGGVEHIGRENGSINEMDLAIPLSVVPEPINIKTDSVDVAQEEVAAPVSKLTEDPNKRRMEEDLAARINNDLGPEHMEGLIEILMRGSAADNEVQDMDEMDLSSLDEATLVEVYHYLESCCIQTVGLVIAAEQREQAECQMMQAAYFDRTPALSPTHSSSSSSSPSPPHPSSIPATPSKSGRSKKRHEAEHQTEQDNIWTAAVNHPYKSSARRKRSNTTSRSKAQKDGQHQQYHHSSHLSQGVSNCEPVILRAAGDDSQNNDMDYGEDAEIDIVGI
ncbi:hypothetical protein BGZ76_010612 [Entomortierella beljakovae]|nr:hypothetical protein BGZ76_010612 [Entomortierella beljakovae]